MENNLDKVTAFDMLFTNNHIQMLKILMSCFDPAMQKNLAIYIKYMELQHTINFFQKYPTASLNGLSAEPNLNLPGLLDEMIAYCGPKEKENLNNMRNMFQTMEKYKEMMEMMQMMKELFPEGESPFDSASGMGGNAPNFLSAMSGLDPGLLSGMAGMFGGSDFDPSQMFEMFQAMSDLGGDSNGQQQEPPGMDEG